MRIIAVFTLMLVLTSQGSCTSLNSDYVIGITQIARGGDRLSHKLIGTDSINVNRVYQSNLGYKESMDLSTYFISAKSLGYIKEYILKHCNPVNTFTAETKDLFIIEVISSNQTQQVCYIASKDSSKVFFSGLREWILNSPHKNDCQKLITDLEPLSDNMKR